MATQRAIEINGQSLPVREYQGQRVVTVNDVATVHNVQKESIHKMFYRNKKHFIENIDYFKVKGKKSVYSVCPYASKMTTEINVFTESGYLMLAKSLTDDLSWQVQRELVNNYFKLRVMGEEIREMENATLQAPRNDKEEDIRIISNVFELLEDSYKRLLYYRVEKQLTQEETARVMELSITRIGKMEKYLKQAGVNIPKQENGGSKYRLTVNSYPRDISMSYSPSQGEIKRGFSTNSTTQNPSRVQDNNKGSRPLVQELDSSFVPNSTKRGVR